MRHLMSVFIIAAASILGAGAAYANEQQPALGSILYVDDSATGADDGSSWCDAFVFLQDALDEALSSGGAVTEIHAAQGTYKPDQGISQSLGDREATFQLINGTALMGGYAGCDQPNADGRDVEENTTILSGDLSGNDVPVPCTGNSPDCDAFGGRCGDGFCIISDNNGENSYHVVTGTGTHEVAVLDGFTITSGNANGSNAVDVRGGGLSIHTGSPTVIDCIFAGNTASLNGGGISNYISSPTITRCTFRANAARAGAGMNNENGGAGSVTDCAFVGNSASGSGGAMTAVVFNSTRISQCKFIDNSANKGGAIYHVTAGLQPITNCTFIGNSAAAVGGALYNAGNDASVDNCTFSGNTAALGGGAIYNVLESRVTLTNSVLWGNSPNEVRNQDTSVDKLIVSFNNLKGGFPGGTIDGGGNINSDPLFVDADGPDNIPGTDDDNLRLNVGSPCIDTGDADVMFVPGDTDLDGHARVLCGRVDMGAYEFGIGDEDCDGQVDLQDLLNWAGCMTGPESGPFSEGCEAFDFNGDLDVDLEDFDAFQQVLTGN